MKLFFNTLQVLILSVGVLYAQPAPNDWYYGDFGKDFNGISMNKAYKELIKDQPTNTVVVAIIDSGMDAVHEDLKDNMWVNSKEIPGNGIDDDNNGYIDDIHGWNFIGGTDGKNVGPDTYEATRVYASLKYKYDNAIPSKLNKQQKEEYELYLRAKDIVYKEIDKAEKGVNKFEPLKQRVLGAMDQLIEKMEGKEVNMFTIEGVESNGDPNMDMAKAIAMQYMSSDEDITLEGIKTEIISDINKDMQYYQNKIDYAYNINFDPRATIVKDNYNDPYEKYYGNNDVKGPDSSHGTHVGGIVGAVRDNGIGMDGVAPRVKLMSVRAVPDGDERDKDVANAIRYAVDNGASVINMSFGKGFGTHKELVDDAVRYAASKDVLLVHAAGNSAQNNDVEENFPNARYQKKTGFIFKKRRMAPNWIEVGALSYKQGEYSVAPFSNYGATTVDVFAPGMAIYSTMPENEYAQLQGTSMASPVVAGVAATIRSLYPSLTAVQVKEAIMMSVNKLDIEVYVPGSKTDKVNFSKLCVTGGTVDLYSALVYASKMKGKKKGSKA